MVSLVACANESDTANQQEDETARQIAEGCKHINYGEAIELDASEMSVTAPTVHARYALTLGVTEETFGGTVEFRSLGGTHMLFLTAAADLRVTDSDNNDVAIVSTIENSAACAEATKIFIVELPDGNYSFTIVDANSASIALTIHAYNATHDHDHGHHDDHHNHDDHGDGDHHGDDDHHGDNDADQGAQED